MTDRESHASETLFSFEVLVEYVQIHKPGLVKSGFEPAVGVRLLDFPTLVIYRGHRDKENAATRISNQDVSVQRTVNRSAEYPFRKGKSCLFKINLGLLHTHLSNVPLYVMVLDSSREIPKLLGSSAVSLAAIIDAIKTDVERLGVRTPSAHGVKGLFGLYNLMGEKIGCVSLGCELLSLGASLTPHVGESGVLRFSDHGKTPVKRSLKPSEDVVDTKTRSDDDMLQRCSSNALCLNVELDGQQSDLAVSATEAKLSHGVSTETQTEPARRHAKSIEVEQINFDKEDDLDAYCPPPLYYSCSEERPAGADRYRLIEELCAEDIHTEGEEQELPAERRRSVAPAEEAQRKRATEQSLAPPAPLGEALRGLPLLSALLQELSRLNGQSVELRPHPCSPHTSPTSRDRGSPGPQPQPRRLGRAQSRGPKAGKEAPTPPPKQKLVHRLTRTVRLRLRQRDSERGHRAQPRSGAPRWPASAPQLGSPTARSSARGRAAAPDRNARMPAGGADLDSSQTEAPPLPSPDPASGPGAEGSPGLGQTRTVRVRIPTALSQLSDHSDGDRDSSDPGDPWPPLSHPGFRGGSTRSSHYSSPAPVSFRESPGPSEYQDDFTSAEPTQGSSPDVPERSQPAGGGGSLSSGESERGEEAGGSPAGPWSGVSPAGSLSPCGRSELGSIPSPPPENDQESRDQLGSLGFSSKYQHISELVLDKLPGYTL